MEIVSLDINIESRNDAIVNAPEESMAAILRRIADQIEAGVANGPVFDENRNKVGSFDFMVD